MNINFIINHIYHQPFPDFDPLNPLRTVSQSRFSYDPNHPAALAIIEKLKNAETEGEVREIVWGAFRDMFMDGVDWERSEALFDVWRYYCR